MSRLESRRRQRREEATDSSEDDTSIGSVTDDSADELEITSDSEVESVSKAHKNVDAKEVISKPAVAKHNKAVTVRGGTDKKPSAVKSANAPAAAGVNNKGRKAQLKPSAKSPVAPADTTSDEAETVVEYNDIAQPQIITESTKSAAVTFTASAKAASNSRDTKWASAPSYAKRQQEQEEYRRKLKEDPAFTPNVGKFWGHDDRFSGRGGSRGFRGSSRGRGWAYANRPVIAPPRDSHYQHQQHRTQDQAYHTASANTVSGRQGAISPKSDGFAMNHTASDPAKDLMNKTWVHDKFEEVSKDTRPYGKYNGPAKHQTRPQTESRQLPPARPSPTNRQSPGSRLNTATATVVQKPQTSIAAADKPVESQVTSKVPVVVAKVAAPQTNQKVAPPQPEVERVSFTIGAHAVTIVKQKSTPDLNAAPAQKPTTPAIDHTVKPSVTNPDNAIAKPTASKRATTQPSPPAVNPVPTMNARAISSAHTGRSNEGDIAKMQSNEAVTKDFDTATTGAPPAAVVSQDTAAPRTTKRYLGSATLQQTSPVAPAEQQQIPAAETKSRTADSQSPKESTQSPTDLKEAPTSSTKSPTGTMSPTPGQRSPVGTHIQGAKHTTSYSAREPTAHAGPVNHREFNTYHPSSAFSSLSAQGTDAPAINRGPKSSPRKRHNKPRPLPNSSSPQLYADHQQLVQYDGSPTYPVYTSADNYPIYTTAPAYPTFTSAAAASMLPYVPSEEAMANGESQMPQVPHMQPIMTNSGSFVFMTESGLMVPGDNYSPTYGYPGPYPQYAGYAADGSQPQGPIQSGYAPGVDANGYYAQQHPQPMYFSGPPMYHDPASGMVMVSAPYYPPPMFHHQMGGSTGPYMPHMHAPHNIMPYQHVNPNSTVTPRITELDVNGNGNGSGRHRHHHNHRYQHHQHAQNFGDSTYKHANNTYGQQQNGYNPKVQIRRPDSGEAVDVSQLSA